MVQLGAAIRHEWDLDPGYLTVNHGSFGATPRVVLEAADEWRRRMERQPTRFMCHELPKALRAAAGTLANFLGAAGDDLAFVANATAGCNAVLQSLDLAPGDEIVVLDHGYGAVVKAARHAAARAGAKIVEAAIPFPFADDGQLVANVAAALTPRTRLAVLDHVTSHSAMALPLAQMVQACHARGVPVLADGAHGPGNLDLDLPAIGADWYVGNCHKWLCAAKGAGFIWARPDRQAGLHPPVISHGYQQGFLAEFDWTGTQDFSAWLSVPAAIDFHRRLGGSDLRARNRDLAARGARAMAQRLGTQTGGVPGDNAMALVRLPVTVEPTQQRALILRETLLSAGTDAPLNEIGGAIWLRISAFAYNELADFTHAAEIIQRELAIDLT